MREPIGYLELCQHLLNQGVMTDVIIKHRWAMQAIAKYSVELPHLVEFDQKEMAMSFASHERIIVFDFDRMSGKSTTRYSIWDGDQWVRSSPSRTTESTVEFMFAWLYTATAQWAWYLRFWVWVKEVLAKPTAG